jgi:hypothetical protein
MKEKPSFDGTVAMPIAVPIVACASSALRADVTAGAGVDVDVATGALASAGAFVGAGTCTSDFSQADKNVTRQRLVNASFAGK